MAGKEWGAVVQITLQRQDGIWRGQDTGGGECWGDRTGMCRCSFLHNTLMKKQNIKNRWVKIVERGLSYSYLEINAYWITDPLAHDVENCMGRRACCLEMATRDILAPLPKYRRLWPHTKQPPSRGLHSCTPSHLPHHPLITRGVGNKPCKPTLAKMIPI